MATIRIGTCSWTDEGLLKIWYPRGVSTPKARLEYYAERFDTVEVDSPFYRLPSERTAAGWAERTPGEFVFHVKASGEMTGHRQADEAPTGRRRPQDARAAPARPSEPAGRGGWRQRRIPLERAFAEFREALEPLEAAGKLRGVLLQYPPRFSKSRESLDELAAVRSLLDPLVPLVEFRHRSWLDEEEREDTLRFLERHELSFVSVDSPRTRASNVLPRLAAATHRLAYVRFHGRNWKTWNRKTRTSGERFDWLYEEDELEEWVEPLRELANEAEEVYAMFNNNRYDYAPRSAARLRRVLGEAGIAATGGLEPAAAHSAERLF